jgi:hypothetical protein
MPKDTGLDAAAQPRAQQQGRDGVAAGTLAFADLDGKPGPCRADPGRVQ